MKQILFATVVFFLISCDKNTADPIVPVCKLKTINTDTALSGVKKVSYNGEYISEIASIQYPAVKQIFTTDASGQLIKEEEFLTADSYGPDTMVRSRIEYFYDQAKNVIRTLNYHRLYTAGTTISTLPLNWIDSFKYTSGKISEIKTYEPFNGVNIYQGKSVLTWVNDDLSQITDYDQNNILYYNAVFTYDLTKENKLDSVFTNLGFAYGFNGGRRGNLKMSKHILTKTVSYWTGSTPVTSTFLTTFNSNGFVNSIQETDYGQTYYIYRFEYKCD
jgi:hypothetical protein